jgi:hypothetical protein
MKKPNSTLSLNIQHDYITIKTPNGNYTTSWNGSRASGKLGIHPTAFRNIDRYVETEVRKPGGNYGDVMKTLTDPKVLSTLWPEWNETVEPNNFAPTDKVVFKSDSMFARKFPKGGVVVKVSRINIFVRLSDTNEVIGFDYQTLKKA